MSEGIRKKVILVAGMHRSGTSALTRVLSILGASLPDNLIEGVEGNNEAGFWESQDVVDFHECILKSAGSFWDDWSEFNPFWLNSDRGRYFNQRLISYLSEKLSDTDLLVVKDPRLCRLLPLWFNALNTIDVEPVIIIPFRHPFEVAQSLKARNDFPLVKGLYIWLRHVLDTVYFSKDKNFSIISYDCLLKDWRGALVTIAENAKLSWTRWSPSVLLEIDESLNSKYKHQNILSFDGFSKDYQLFLDVYALLLKASSSNRKIQKIALDKLFSIRGVFNRNAKLFAEILFYENKIFNKKVNYFERHIQNIDKREKQLRKDIEKKDESINELKSLIDHLELNNDKQHAEIIALDEKKQHLEFQLEEYKGKSVKEISDLNCCLEQEKQALSVANHCLLEKEQELKAKSDDLSASKSIVFSLKEELASLSQELAELRLDLSEKGEVAAKAVSLSQELAELKLSLSEYENLLKETVEAKQLDEQELELLKSDLSVKDKLIESKDLALKNSQLRCDFFVKSINDREKNKNILLSSKQLENIKINRLKPGLFVKLPSFLKKIKCGLFDVEFYRSYFSDKNINGYSLYKHYYELGWRLGLKPSLLFDTEWYLSQFDQVDRFYGKDICPIDHYIETGSYDFLSPHPLFDPAWYVEYNNISIEKGNLLTHYLKIGNHLNYSPHPLFDPVYLLNSVQPSIARSYSLLELYLYKDAFNTEVNPNPLFDVKFYLDKYTEVATSGLSALEHYVKFGAALGYQPNRFFDVDFYLSAVGMPSNIATNALSHYIQYGQFLDINPNPLFDKKWYLQKYQDVAVANIDPFTHYVVHGFQENRRPSANVLSLA